MHLSTPHQRLYIRTLMRGMELPTDTVTVMHRNRFKRAGVPFNDGKPLDAELCALRKEQASALIKTLLKETNA